MFKKSISLVLSIAMLLSLTTGIFYNGIFDANATEDVKVTKTLFLEDFQDWEEGTIIEAASDQNAPTFEAKNIISYELAKDNKLEIVKEENGNKYLKITIVSTSSKASHIKYYFPEIYANNKYAISYDFMPETHNKHFDRFGSFIHNKDDGGDTIPLNTKSFGNDLYAANGVGNTAYYIGNLFKSANYANYSYNTYAAVTQTIDLTKSSGNYEFNAVYPGASSITNKTVTNTASQLGIKGLAWKVFQHSSSGYNGKSDGTTSVYRIDNIKVSVECIDVINSSVENGGEIYSNEPVELTFNEAIADNYADYVSVYKNGELASAGYSLSLSDDKKVLTVSGFSGGAEYSVKIGENLKSQDGTKAMKEAYELNFATISNGTDDGEQDPTLLHYEDFEDYKTGVIYEATGYIEGSKDGFYYALYAGDKIEIAKEENGNKYLKFTRGSTGKNSSYVMYAFPEAYSGGVVSVAYDYKPEGHSQTFNHFGTVASTAHGVGKTWSTNKSVIQPIISYAKNIYVHSGTNSSYYVGGINNIGNYTSDEYATVTQTFDFTKDADNYKFNAKYKNSGKNIGTVKRTVNTADVNAMAWAVYKHATAANNGPDSSSVYRIDNITVKREIFEVINSSVKNGGEISSNKAVKLTFNEAIADDFADYVSVYKDGALLSEGYTLSLSEDKTVLSVSGFEADAEYSVKISENLKSQDGLKAMKAAYELSFATVLFYEDFEDYEVGVIKDATQYIKSSKGNIYYELYESDKVEIVQEENGNKYLQFTRAAEKSQNSFVMYKFPQAYSEGGYLVSYDFRPENHSQHFTQFGGLVATAQNPTNWGKTSIQPILSYKGNFYVNSTVANASAYYVEGLGAKTNYAEGAFATVTQKVDFEAKSNNYTFSATYPNASGTYTSLDAITRTVSAADIAAVGWAVKKYADSADYNGPDRDNGAAVYKIDNIRVEEVEYESTVAPEIVASTIENGANDISYKTNNVVLSLNDVLVLKDSVTKENVKLYKNDAYVDSYSVALDENNCVKVDFNLDANASYKLEVKGLTAKGKNPLVMESTYVLNFETVEDIYVNNLALNLTDKDKVFNITAKIYNNSEAAVPYQAFAVVRENDGTFKGIYLAEENTVSSQDNADISILGVNVDLTTSYCELYIWESLENLKPILVKKKLNNITAGKTIVFAQGANSVLVDGELINEEAIVYKDGDNLIIPTELASKYIFETSSDLTAEDLKKSGWGVYVSDEYGFIVIGDDVDFDDTKALETINKFGIFVSPDGDDLDAGYASSPVRTLARAVEIYENGNNNPVFVHAGEYRLTETLNLSSKSSGLTIKDFGDGEVKVSGAIELPADAFIEATSAKIPEGARGYVKQIDLSSYISEDMTAYPEFKTQHASTAYYELFSGDVAQTIARWPNKGFKTIDFGGIFGDLLEKDDEIPVTREKVSLWKNAENGMIAGYFKYDWAFENILIDKENSSGSTIKLSKVPTYKIENGQRYYAMNMLEELDVAGEYYIDNASKILYYYPTDDFGSINPELSVMTDALVSMTKANNVKVSGITFENTRGKGVVTSGGSISLDNCVLRNIGNNAVSISSSDSEVVNSHIYSIGGPAAVVTAGNNDKLTSGNVRITNNKIHNFGRIFRSYQGAIHLNGCGNIAEYNTIYDAPHNAIRFSGSNHKILNNEIYNVVNETCDAGAIYAGRSWTGWGNEIKNNYFHDIKDNVGSDSKVVAVYIDDMFSGVTVENNVMKACECAALFGGGRGNKFVDNTVVDCTIGLQYDSKGEGSSHMKVDTDDSSDTILEAFIKYIAKESVVNTMEERRKNYHGFGTLVDDVNAYVADSSYAQIGYAKDAVITGNGFYGSNVKIDVVNRVKDYGTYTDNTTGSTAPEYSLPDCGVRN